MWVSLGVEKGRACEESRKTLGKTAKVGSETLLTYSETNTEPITETMAEITPKQADTNWSVTSGFIIGRNDATSY